MKTNKYYIYLIILFTLIIYINPILNILNKKKIDRSLETEINILKTENEELQKELMDITNLNEYTNYNYSLTKIISRTPFLTDEFYIIGGTNKGYKENNLLVNEYGVVGIITDVYKNYSKCKYILNVSNLAVVINDSYGTLNKNEDNYIIINNISNYDKVSLNDHVFVSNLGDIKEKLYIGYVYNIKNTNKGKVIYIKSDVNFYDINYLYVVGVQV